MRCTKLQIIFVGNATTKLLIKNYSKLTPIFPMKKLLQLYLSVQSDFQKQI